MAMDLEAPTPPPAPDPAPAAPAAPAEPVAPAAPVDPDDATAVEVQGGKYVPLAVVKQLREDQKALKEKAAKADQYEQYLLAKAPYLKVLEENPHLLDRAATPPPAAPAPPTADPHLIELAKSLDYYKSDGSPDLERATKHRDLVRREAQEIAQQMVGPIAQTTYEQRSAANYTQMATQKLPNGQPVDQQVLAKYWRSLPAQYTADPRIAAVAYNLAAMEQMSNSPLPPAPPPVGAPPLVTEPIGGSPRAAKLSDLEKAVAAGRGMDEGKFAKLQQGFVAGRPSSLED